MALMPVDEALARILDGAAASDETEMLGLADSGGRVLARDLLALRTQPPFSASAMDGYAVRASEAVTGAKLRLQGESAAGHGFDAPLAPGSTIRIFTGAPVPEGADTVLIQENTERLEDGLVLVTQAPEAGRNIRPQALISPKAGPGLQEAACSMPAPSRWPRR
jgi:molybdopterin molybdotransferase